MCGDLVGREPASLAKQANMLLFHVKQKRGKRKGRDSLWECNE